MPCYRHLQISTRWPSAPPYPTQHSLTTKRTVRVSCWSVHRPTVGSLARLHTAPFSTRRRTAVKRRAMIIVPVVAVLWPIANSSSQPRAAAVISTSRPRRRPPSSRQPSPSSWCKLRCFFHRCRRRKTRFNNKTHQITSYQSWSSIIAETTSNNFQAQRKCSSPSKRAVNWASRLLRSRGSQPGATSPQIRLSSCQWQQLTWPCVRSPSTYKRQRLDLEVCHTLRIAARLRLWPTLHPCLKAVENQLNRYITIITRHAVIRSLPSNYRNRPSSLTP